MPKQPSPTVAATPFAACRPPDGYAHLLNRKEVAAHFRISERHLKDLEKQHAVPVIRAGRAIRYDKHAFEYLVEALRMRHAAPVPHVPLSNTAVAYVGGGYERVKAAVEAAQKRNAARRR